MITTLHEMFQKRIPVIFDGAMGTRIQAYEIGDKDYGGHPGCNEVLSLSRPEVIVGIHKEYLAAGAHVVETNTFGGNRVKLAEYGIAAQCYEINRSAAMLAARAVAESGVDRPAFVCGVMGPTGHLPSSGDLGRESMAFDELADVYTEQAQGLLDGGADMLLLETMQDLLEARAAMYGLRRLLHERGMHTPLLVHVSVDAAGRMLLGSDIFAFLGAMGNLTPSAIGFNCNVGPVEMAPNALRLLQSTHLPVSMVPNAGMPENVGGKAVYTMGAEAFAEAMVPMVVEHGAAIVGGCCGTTPEHIRALAQALEGKNVAVRSVAPKTYLSTGIGGFALESASGPLIIGERLNTQGSKKTKELVLARNFDELYHIALEQEKKGSGLIDLCVAINERDDEKDTMTALAVFLSQRVKTPFCIDSTEQAVFEQALKACPGSVMINSINLERNGEKARPILALARDFGCPVIALTIDDEGMASTMPKKLDLAVRLRDLACGRFGLPEHFLYIDPLTFTLATGDPQSADAAKISIEAIFRIKDQMPKVRTVMGVSNVSFGLKPISRRALNNLMLHHAVKAGLDAAIFNPLHLDNVENYDPELRLRGENLLFNRAPNALSEFIEYFESKAPAEISWTEPKGEPPALAPEEQLREKVLRRDPRGLSELLDILLAVHPADHILNAVLLPAMEEVGQRMARGEMILPFVLQAAEVMKEALAVLEPHLLKTQTAKRGKIILATVYGDVHDIGKNLVGSILKNQGFEIIDLGKQVPVDVIIEAALRERPDAIGLSALLVATSRQMRHCVEACCREGLSVPILIGGAAVNSAFARSIALCNHGKPYTGGVFYAKDSFEAMRIVDDLKKNAGTPRTQPPVPGKSATAHAEAAPAKAPEELDYGELLVPPFYGTGEVLSWDAKTLLDSINAERLFKAYWGGGNLPPEEFEKAVREEFGPALELLKAEIVKEGLLDARGMYAYFPVYASGETLHILDPGDFHTELADFSFPRVARKAGRSLADYFRPEGDVIAMQVVTVGKGLGERSAEYLQKDNKYALGFYLNGMGSWLAEHLAERVTGEIRRGLFLGRDQGRRYSFGYPGLPGVEEQRKIFEIMAVEERLGIVLTPGFQMQPEHSTMGIFVAHPRAEYL